jgi:hypothetical protein
MGGGSRRKGREKGRKKERKGKEKRGGREKLPSHGLWVLWFLREGEGFCERLLAQICL